MIRFRAVVRPSQSDDYHRRLGVFVVPDGSDTGAYCGADLVMREAEAHAFAQLIGTADDPGLLDEVRYSLSNGLDAHAYYDIGPHLTCSEANSLAHALNMLDLDDEATSLLDGHSLADEDDTDDPDHIARAVALRA